MAPELDSLLTPEPQATASELSSKAVLAGTTPDSLTELPPALVLPQSAVALKDAVATAPMIAVADEATTPTIKAAAESNSNTSAPTIAAAGAGEAALCADAASEATAAIIEAGADAASEVENATTEAGADAVSEVAAAMTKAGADVASEMAAAMPKAGADSAAEAVIVTAEAGADVAVRVTTADNPAISADAAAAATGTTGDVAGAPDDAAAAAAALHAERIAHSKIDNRISKQNQEYTLERKAAFSQWQLQHQVASSRSLILKADLATKLDHRPIGFL